jgi:BirA family biotin operon repressor/biotin-[acetyl-CoA-carboxylase] ligase
LISESLNFEHIHLLTVDSTNRFAFEFISKTNPTDGFCVFSDVQTAGRGQYGREWHSESGSNILASFIFRTEFIPLEEIFVLHQLASLSVLAVLDAFGLSESQIKWPNDIIIRDKKIAGILIQNSLRAHQLQYSVLGIGLNVNQLEFKGVENACSMKSMTHQDFEVKKILAALHDELMSKFEALKNGLVDSWLEKYNKRLFGLGSLKLFQNPDGKLFNAQIVSVNKFGEIILEDEKVQKNYDFGSIKMVWPQGPNHL